jgi:hypothetical protein
MLRLLTVPALGLSLLLGCSGEDNGYRPPPPGDGDADSDGDGDTDADGGWQRGQCADDTDGDGFGVLCPAGEDCNDIDPERHDDCSTCRPGIPQENCPCSGTEDPVSCESKRLYEDEHGRLRCRKGLQLCQENPDAAPETSFAWTECLDDQGAPIDD